MTLAPRAAGLRWLRFPPRHTVVTRQRRPGNPFRRRVDHGSTCPSGRCSTTRTSGSRRRRRRWTARTNPRRQSTSDARRSHCEARPAAEVAGVPPAAGAQAPNQAPVKPAGGGGGARSKGSDRTGPYVTRVLSNCPPLILGRRQAPFQKLATASFEQVLVPASQILNV